jgi:DNA-binding beta-propeller fold protein YncE
MPWTSIPTDVGGVAVNYDGTLYASANLHEHCVYIYRVDCLGKRTADVRVVVGAPPFPGYADGYLYFPRFLCFVRRHDVDTLLICDWGNSRVVEVGTNGVFLRTIAVSSNPYGIAYCGTGDVIAVSLFHDHSVVLLHYESGGLKAEAAISGEPMGVSFTVDGRYLLATDHKNHRVSTFSAVSGAFVAHVPTEVTGIVCPRDVLQCADGSIVVAQHGKVSVVSLTEGGAPLENIIFPSATAGSECPFSLAFSPALGTVVVKTFEGNMFLLRDAWILSSRCAWLSALTA